MPYTTDSPGLPDKVKALSDNKKAQWVKVFNSALESCEADDGDDCEASAFAQANGVVFGEEAEPYVEAEGNEMYYALPRCITVASGPLASGYVTTNTAHEMVEFFDNATDDDPFWKDWGGIEGRKWARKMAKKLPKIQEVKTEPVGGEAEPVNDPPVTTPGEAMDELKESLQPIMDEFVERVVTALEKKLAGIAELSEAESGTAIALVETDNGASGPLVVDIAVIEPGPGNKKDGHYYPREMLAEHAGVFAGVKMYATDHRPEEKNVRTEVSEILQCPVDFTETGAPIARVGIFDETFAQNVRNRAELGTLNNLNCSILAEGTARKGEIDGTEYKIVEAITQAQSVDWVTRAGAGGRALRLAEVDSMEEEKTEETKETEEKGEKAQVGEAEPVTISEKESEQESAPEPTFLAEVDVQTALGVTSLPDASKERLADAQYADDDALQAAIHAEVAYVKKLTGSGRPFAQGVSQVTQPKPRTEEEKIAGFNEIMREIGAREV